MRNIHPNASKLQNLPLIKIKSSLIEFNSLRSKIFVDQLYFCFFFLFFQDGASYGSTRIARGPIMEIDNVRKEDSGTYICTASNNVGTISADQIELKVLCKFFSHLFYHALRGKNF